jgi:alanine racemase
MPVDVLPQNQVIELDSRALIHNLELVRSTLSPETRLLGVVKANAYGHGAAEVAPLAARYADWLGVHSADEARAIRALGVRCPLLVMGFVPRPALHDLDAETHLLVSTVEALPWIAEYRDRTGISIPVHLKVDTGTKRQGIAADCLASAVRKATELRLDIVGVATHFANIEDTLEHEFARLQLDRFHDVVNRATTILGARPPFVHAACSAASLLFRETDFSLARVGISMYGHWPSRETRLSWILEHGRNRFDLQPVLSWRAVIGQFQTVSKGESVGYGRTWTALRDTVLAVIPVGYADGYSRALGNRSRVLVRGREAPVVGRVCMNIFMADVTDISDLDVGDRVTLIGRDGDAEVSVEDLAAHCGTINYEFLASLSPTIPRVLHD